MPSSPFGVPVQWTRTVTPSPLAQTERAERQAAAYSGPTGDRHSNAESNAYAHTASGHVTSGTRIVTVASNGFDWGDAGIGAAGGLALAMLGVGAGLAMSQHRTRRAATPQA